VGELQTRKTDFHPTPLWPVVVPLSRSLEEREMSVMARTSASVNPLSLFTATKATCPPCLVRLKVTSGTAPSA